MRLLLLLNVLTIGNGDQFFWENFLGYKPRDGYYEVKREARTLFDCISHVCGTVHEECLIAYNQKTRHCWKVIFPVQVAVWNVALSFERDNIWNVIYQKRIHDTSPKRSKFFLEAKPSLFWLFDSGSNGTNFGSLGREMDVYYTASAYNKRTGPKGGPLKYSIGHAHLEIPIPTTQLQGQSLPKINLNTAPFTIAMWVHITTATNGGLLFGTKPLFSTRFELWSPYQGEQENDRLVLALNEDIATFALSEKAGIKYEGWYFLAVTYDYESNRRVAFYVNSKKLILVQSIPPNMKMIHPTHIQLWESFQDKKRAVRLNAALACVSLFDTALSARQVHRLGNSCP